ncbi:DUF4132 domain-containing protein [Actinomadura sp. WMMB 499]|uniref:DUF4132 domain-containing protein n=1 Tax=Actinomadura sp. WMMB 499 TaxID=1219491 RepID=UPI0012462EB3|nr:DUF4132 domain-containing protein [Actinomadura sp. WMMB 499]QFG20440.1 DUF4132 domain-containing protein [Actinomadura sp. WMMB 499]
MSDENALRAGDARHPRRDRPHVPEPPAPDPALVARAGSLVDGARDGIEGVLALAGTDPDVAEAARAHLRGDANPLGAAAVAHVTGVLRNLHRSPEESPFPHAWTAEHGPAFAAAAFMEMGGILADATFHRSDWRWAGVRRRNPDEAWGGWWLQAEDARPLRARLAAAPGDVYAEAVEGLAGRRGHGLQRLIAAYLAPTREDWVEELCANPGPAATDHYSERWLLFCALGAPHQPAVLGLPLAHRDRGPDVLLTLVDGVGPEAATPLLAEALDAQYAQGQGAGCIPEVLGGLPVDGAFRALVERIDRPGVPPALLAAARRFPTRAVRLLAGTGTARAADLLAAHVRMGPDLAESMLPELPAEARRTIRATLDACASRPPAPDLPPLLTEPPWTRPGTKAKPVVIKDLPLPGTRAVAWAPGEREEWTARRPRFGPYGRDLEPAKAAARFAAGTLANYEAHALFALGPDELVRPLLAGWEPDPWNAEDWLPPIVGRFETDAAGAALSVARRDPALLGGMLLPLLDDRIARTMADWLVRLKSAGKTARAWFGRHGTAAAPALVPDALGKAGPARRAAEHALRLIADRHGPDTVVEAARAHGDEAAAAIGTLLAADPLDTLPKKIPSVGWVEIRALPPLLLRDRTHALPDDAVRHVLTMLAMSNPDDVYAGVHAVRELSDPDSLAEFGWALFRWWDVCGAPPKENWALTQLASTGDDETVRRLTPVIRAWPGEGGHAKAVLGLDVLAAIGTGTALMHLNSISQRVKFKALKKRAQEKIGEVAAGLELTAEQLADRLVPDFGLDASGTLTLDYGPRRFVVAFDEQLRPTITDDTGKPRKSLPKPGAKDDPELAPAAAKRFAALKKDLRAVASDQLARLERAMVDRRRWTPAEFRELLVAHPLLHHLVRRLVWTTDGGPAFRVAEDGTFADSSDDTVTVPDGARVGVAHPLDLGGDLPAWTELFADYEILQPFVQLARPVHALTGEERAGARLDRLDGLKVPPRAVLGLVGRGWERGAPQDAGVEAWISRRAGTRRFVVIDLSPGITVDLPDEFGDQSLGVRITEHPEDRYFGRDDSGSLTFGDLDPVAASEILADLDHLAASAR